tara:strand:+ start:1455 stop:1793 length:339 start_codon:yes stop_codon:yes gene_type:complete
MQSETQKTTTHPFRFFAFALLAFGTAFAALYAVANLQTDVALTFTKLVEEVSYDLNPDGTAVHRFGRNGYYNITCQGEAAISWDLPASRSSEEIAHVCAKIEAHRNDSAAGT